MIMECFVEQTYRPLEWVVVDDSIDFGKYEHAFRSAFHLYCSGDSQLSLTYIKASRKLPMGIKYNIAGAAAYRSPILAFIGDDDWFHPERIKVQSAPIIYHYAEATALGDMYMYNMLDDAWWLFDGTRTGKYMDTSLVMTRRFWESHPFPEKHAPEPEWLDTAKPDTVVINKHADHLVQLKHAWNVSARPFNGWLELCRLNDKPQLPERCTYWLDQLKGQQLLLERVNAERVFFSYAYDDQPDDIQALAIGRELAETALSEELAANPLVIFLALSPNSWNAYSSNGRVLAWRVVKKYDVVFVEPYDLDITHWMKEMPQ